MASSSAFHPTFASRNPANNPRYTSTAAPTPFGASTANPTTREAQRLERERQVERERLEREGQNQFNQLSDEQKEEINEAFGLFDLDKDKHIDYHELKVAMKALGFNLPKAELVNILTTYGVPPTTGVRPVAATGPSQTAGGPPATHPSRLLLPLSTFQTLMAQRILNRDPRDEILRAFELFDEAGKGKIDLDDLRRVARELGEGLQEEELIAMIEEFDMDGDGAIDRDEFVGICMQ